MEVICFLILLASSWRITRGTRYHAWLINVLSLWSWYRGCWWHFDLDRSVFAKTARKWSPAHCCSITFHHHHPPPPCRFQSCIPWSVVISNYNTVSYNAATLSSRRGRIADDRTPSVSARTFRLLRSRSCFFTFSLPTEIEFYSRNNAHQYIILLFTRVLGTNNFTVIAADGIIVCFLRLSMKVRQNVPYYDLWVFDISPIICFLGYSKMFVFLIILILIVLGFSIGVKLFFDFGI